MSGQVASARSHSLANCHGCGRLSPLAGVHGGACRVCGAALHLRKPQSVQRTWSLVLSAAALYIPANLYPVMTIKTGGSGDPHTIIGGAVALFEGGSYASGFLVLFASVTVPLFKIVGIILMLLCIRKGSRWRLRDRTRVYRIIEIVGRWSMIDMFMVSILVALVNLGVLAVVEPGLGAIFFASVVVLTMIAASSFDPRIMWDSAEEA